jgi:phage gp46-like protein
MDLQTRFNDQLCECDWSLDGGALVSDAGLQSAVVISLFTDRRAEADDILPDGASDRRGWWGDVVAPKTAPTDKPWLSGSRLWLLSREKQTTATAQRVEFYTREALAWMVEIGVASAVDVSATWIRQGFLALDVTIHRPNGVAETYDLIWQGGL